MTVEAELQQALISRKIKGTEASEAAGLSRQQLCDSFYGRRRLKADELLLICGAFNIDPMQFEASKKAVRTES